MTGRVLGAYLCDHQCFNIGIYRKFPIHSKYLTEIVIKHVAIFVSLKLLAHFLLFTSSARPL